jgi:predicted dienelactone hydrolase
MMGACFTNSFQTIELASHGYVVAAVEHPQTALTAAYPDGSFVPFVDFFSKLSMEYEAQNVVSIPVIEEQTRDLEFALEQIKKLGEAKFRKGDE